MSDPEMTTFGMYPEPEPVAWLHMLTVDGELFPKPTLVPRSDQDIPLYTAQPRREWVGLTDEEYELMAEKCVTSYFFNTLDYAHAIEAKLKEKNVY
jgi:hypothetical protein